MKSSHAFWFLFYNLFVIPPLYGGAQLARFFNPKIKRGIRERKGLFSRLRQLRGDIPEGKRIVVIHCASAGEFEAARPLLSAIHERLPDSWIHVTCYSPSGIKPVSNADEVDSFSYLPFDDLISAGRFFQILDPAALLVVKHDIWPNMIWAAARRNIPTLWINANLHEKSSRLGWLTRGLNRSFLDRLTAILTVGDAHAVRLSTLASPAIIRVVGDSRYDRTEQRMNQAKKRAGELLDRRWFKGSKVILGGSTWGPDQRVLIPAYARLKKEFPELYLILVPHEPHEDFLAETNYYLRGHDLNPIRYSQLGDELPHSDALLIDKVGILASLYRLAWVAYVGGAFGDGVHSVLEPAVYGVPLFFGPKYYMAQEAKTLLQRGGAVSVTSADQLQEKLRSYLEDKSAYKKAAAGSRQVVELGLGATDRIVTRLAQHLNQPPIT